MSSSYFFTRVSDDNRCTQILESAREIAERERIQTYVIKKSLADGSEDYSYEHYLIVLSPKHKIILLDFGGNRVEIEDFKKDFVEDLSAISQKYKYKSIIGRSRDWEDLIVTHEFFNEDANPENFFGMLNHYKINDPQQIKVTDLLISLLTGSINDIEKVKKEIPETILDKVKQKILLFDGDQTRFIYGTPDKKVTRIQGLSGTGKTELLLHKLKELYLNSDDGKIFFTCHNKILANNLRQRIPAFFNFMKVEEQIEWNSRLWCQSAWGSGNDKNSGLYAYICKHFSLPFLSYGYVDSVSSAAKIALTQLDEIFGGLENIPPIFDYVLIDESQDFEDPFFQLCECVTKKHVYVAGDIFQSIFAGSGNKSTNPDYLLSKCYRTDPRTLMVAHSLGMGLFEQNKLQWLEDEVWNECGYLVEKYKNPGDQTNTYELKREPLRRFEDVDVESIEIVSKGSSQVDNVAYIIETIEKILKDHHTATQEDIGIVFLQKGKAMYQIADMLQREVFQRWGWEVNKAYETRQKKNKALFISNKNHVKGLEFPFVICVMGSITGDLNLRNSLYMTLTRSFIKTYLMLEESETNIAFIEQVHGPIEKIKKDGVIITREPTDQEKQRIWTKIQRNARKLSYTETFAEVYEELKLESKYRDTLFNIATSLLEEKFKSLNKEDFVEALKEVLMQNYALITRY